jgi:membrane protein
MWRRGLRGATSAVHEPTDLTREEWIHALKTVQQQLKYDDVSSLASGVAYRIFLSLFPSLIAAVAIFSLVADPARLNDYVQRAAAFVPEQALGLVQSQLARLIEGDGAGGIAIVAILGGLWAAIGAAQAIMKALNRAYEVVERRNALVQRAVALVLTVALLVALIGLVVLLVFGPQLVEFLFPAVLLRNGLGVLITIGRYVAAFLLLIVLFAFVYAVGPSRPAPRWVWMSPGAILSVIGWLLASYGFSLYTRFVASYDVGGPYGTFGGVIVLLIWLQLTFLILLTGAELNAEVERVAEHAAGTGESPLAPPEMIAIVPDDKGVVPLQPRARTAPAPATMASGAASPDAAGATTGPVAALAGLLALVLAGITVSRRRQR